MGFSFARRGFILIIKFANFKHSHTLIGVFYRQVNSVKKELNAEKNYSPRVQGQ